MIKGSQSKISLKNHLRVSKVDARMHQICSIFWPPPLASFWVVTQFTDGWNWCRKLFWQPLFAQWAQVNCFGVVMPGIVLKVETVQDFLYEIFIYWKFSFFHKCVIANRFTLNYSTSKDINQQSSCIGICVTFTGANFRANFICTLYRYMYKLFILRRENKVTSVNIYKINKMIRYIFIIITANHKPKNNI